MKPHVQCINESRSKRVRTRCCRKECFSHFKKFTREMILLFPSARNTYGSRVFKNEWTRKSKYGTDLSDGHSHCWSDQPNLMTQSAERFNVTKAIPNFSLSNICTRVIHLFFSFVKYCEFHFSLFFSLSQWIVMKDDDSSSLFLQSLLPLPFKEFWSPTSKRVSDGLRLPVLVYCWYLSIRMFFSSHCPTQELFKSVNDVPSNRNSWRVILFGLVLFF